NAEIVTLKAEQGPGLGEAMLAALGLGWFENMDSCADHFVAYTDAIQPIPEKVAVYETIYQHYKAIYPNVKNIK
ncbi:xylulokinase, partial [Streptococcus suis]